MTDQIAVITHHEAAHAVAALMTANTELDDRMNVSVGLIDGGVAGGHSEVLVSNNHPVQAAFIFYAGPWAEVRVEWRRPVNNLDETDESGVSFHRIVEKKFTYGPGSDGARYLELNQVVLNIPDNAPYWSSQLEMVWPVTDKLADALRDRLNAAEPQPYLPGLGANRTMRWASMSNGEAVALVRPLLEARGLWRYLS